MGWGVILGVVDWAWGRFGEWAWAGVVADFHIEMYKDQSVIM